MAQGAGIAAKGHVRPDAKELAGYELPLVVAPCFSAVSTLSHLAPTPHMVPTGVEEEPAAFIVSTGPNLLEIRAQQKVASVD